MIAKMTHIRLVGLRSQENKIIDGLIARGLFEARATDEPTDKPSLQRGDGSSVRELKLKQGKISFALDFIEQRHGAMREMLSESKKAAKKQGLEKPELDFELSDRKFSSARMLITHADFSDVRAKEYDLLGVCDELQRISFETVDCRTKRGVIDNKIRDYTPYAAFPLPLSVLGREGGIRVSAYLGGTDIPTDGLKEYKCAFDAIPVGDGTLVTVIYRREKSADVDRLFGTGGFVKCPYTDDCTAAHMIDALQSERADVDRHEYELTRSALDYEKYYDELRILYDVVGLEIERVEVADNFLKSDSTFLLEGWLPEAVAESVIAEVKAECPNIFVQMLAPEERDAPPTLVVNNKIIEPYEDITNMYSPPKYREIDPNPVMSIFFFLFFGLMVGDAAYGVILAAVGLTLGFSKKLDIGTRKLLQLIGWGGVAAIFWGVLFGSYFGIDFGETKVALWFNPIEDPMTMLYLSIALGVIQLTVGYVMMFIKLCKDGKPFSAIFDAGSIILLFAALVCLAVGMVANNPTAGLAAFASIPESVRSGLTTAAIVLAVSGLALMIVFGGRNNKNVFGKIFGGFKGVYGLINLLSDLLSYCRLFGLALSSCAIALAFNTLGLTLGAAGYVVLVVLHIFNIALAVLSAYVHNARLQVLEFYGKFYDGEGRLFEPVGSKTKHIRYA